MSFYPIIGWPAGRGEYDNLFRNLDYFCNKIDHWSFLFNFASFIFGFNIPSTKPFFNDYAKYRDKSFKEILIEYTGIEKDVASKLKILLDVGGNRIFNKIIHDDLPVEKIDSYKIYLEAYSQFIRVGNPDIYVNFDIGPSYSSRDEIAIRGRQEWEKLSKDSKGSLNAKLLEISISNRQAGSEIMVPVNATDPRLIQSKLMDLHKNFKDSIDYIGVAGIANLGGESVTNILKIFDDFRIKNKWDVKIHGLGLGGWKKLFFLTYYGVESCDVATPWRRACTERISQVYIPLLDSDLEVTKYPDPLSYKNLHDERYEKLVCGCPFCNDIPMNEVRTRCMKADKKFTKKKLHDPDFREMRVRVFFHNVFQHIAILRKLNDLKDQYGNNCIRKFLEEIQNPISKKKIKGVVKHLL